MDKQKILRSHYKEGSLIHVSTTNSKETPNKPQETSSPAPADQAHRSQKSIPLKCAPCSSNLWSSPSCWRSSGPPSPFWAIWWSAGENCPGETGWGWLCCRGWGSRRWGCRFSEGKSPLCIGLAGWIFIRVARFHRSSSGWWCPPGRGRPKGWWFHSAAIWRGGCLGTLPFPACSSAPSRSSSQGSSKGWARLWTRWGTCVASSAQSRSSSLRFWPWAAWRFRWSRGSSAGHFGRRSRFIWAAWKRWSRIAAETP